MLLECLKRIAPGTELRLGMEYILQAKTGGLIVIGDSEEVLKLVNGGFYIGCGFSPNKFYELAKMDGAIILSSNARRILYKVLYGSSHGPGTHGRIISFFQQQILGAFLEFNHYALELQCLAYSGHHKIHDIEYLLLGQLVEYCYFIYTV